MASQTVAEFIVSFLEGNGIDRAFCLPGESFLPLIEAFRTSTIDLITARHESSAGFMAVADARLTGRPGVAVVSRGPGASNASIAVHTAQHDGLPLILLVGQVPRDRLKRDGFQEIDYDRMFGGIAKWTIEIVDRRQLACSLMRAFGAAIGDTPGPVVISLPEDLLLERTEAFRSNPIVSPISAPDSHAVGEAAEMLRRAASPLIIAGGEFAVEGGRDVLLRLAESWRVPVLVSFRRHDLFPNDHVLYAGDLGISNTEEQLATLAEADLILALGTRLGDLTTQGYRFPRSPNPEQRLVHVHGDGTILGRHYQAELALICRAVPFAAALLAHPVGGFPALRSDWIERVHAYPVALSQWRPRKASDGVVFGNVIAALSRHAQDDALIVPDAGISAALIYRYFPFRHGQRLMATLAGVMGFGVPGAIAASLRRPGQRIISIIGDGGFMMTGAEIALAVQFDLPIAFLIANNRSLGSIRRHQERLYPGKAKGTDLAGPDFAEMACSFGCRALTLENEEQIDDALRIASNAPGPILIDVKTSLTASFSRNGQD